MLCISLALVLFFGNKSHLTPRKLNINIGYGGYISTLATQVERDRIESHKVQALFNSHIFLVCFPHFAQNQELILLCVRVWRVAETHS